MKNFFGLEFCVGDEKKSSDIEIRVLMKKSTVGKKQSYHKPLIDSK